MAAAGDATGDGIADLAVGAPAPLRVLAGDRAGNARRPIRGINVPSLRLR